jgi:cupin 2 domain-containing protein
MKMDEGATMTDAAHPANLFAGIPSDLPEEAFLTLLAATGLRIERVVSHGHASPDGFWYDQDEHEWVIVLRGAASLRFEGDPQAVPMRVGDTIQIAAHRRHRVEWTTPDEPTVWLAVHYQTSPP